MIFNEASGFEWKVLKRVRFGRNTCIQKITFWSVLLRGFNYFCIFLCFYWKQDFEFKYNTMSLLQLHNFERVEVCFWKLTTCQSNNQLLNTCQIFNSIFYNVSLFESTPLHSAKFCCVHENRALFGTVIMYDVCPVSQIIVLGWILWLPIAINVGRYIKTVDPTRECSSKYLVRKWYSTQFYYRLWGLKAI